MKNSIQLLSIFFVLLLFGCSQEVQKRVTISPEFAQHISAYTSGIVSRDSTINIMLTEDVSEEFVEAEEPIEDLIRFVPEVQGEAKFVSTRMIEFTPSELLQSGIEYTAYLDLSKVKDLPSNAEEFAFQFKTIEQDLDNAPK